MNYRTCEVLRGVAIIGIFLHNYCHWLGPIVKENEYTYSQHHVDVLQQVLAAPDGQLPLHLVSFFGHYGVPLFLFLSAYGLVCKYERSGGPLPGTWRFVRYHFLKLFKMMVVGFVSFTVIDAITPGRWHYTVTQVVAQMAMVNNLLPYPDRQIWPGPYWFFGLMLQLYIVYRVALCRRSWRVTVIGMAVCVGIQLLLDCDGDAINRYRYNFMGGMLPFGLGLLYARYGERWRGRIGGSVWLWTVVSTVAVYVLSLHPVAWTFAPIAVCVAGVSGVKALTSVSWAGGLTSALQWMGDISAALFVCHPILRKVFIPISRQGDVYTGLLLYIIASVCVAWLFREVMKKIPNPRP